MASSFSFHLAVALLLVLVSVPSLLLVHQQAAGEQDGFDLDKAIEREVERTAVMFNSHVLWWDVTNEREEVKRKFTDIPPVTVTAGDVEYGASKSSAKRPCNGVNMFLDNGLPSPEKVHHSLSKTCKRTGTWLVEAGFNYSGNVAAPTTMHLITGHRINVNLKGGHRAEVFDVEKFTHELITTLPPLTYKNIEWTIFETVQEVLWTSPVTVTGYYFFKIGYGNDQEGILLRSSLDFLDEDGRFRQTGKNKYQYTAKGTFAKVTGHQSQVNASDSNYTMPGENSSAVRTYTIPLSLTPHTPTAKTP